MVNIITPWEVKGKIDYGRLITDFGLQSLDNLPNIFQKQVLFRRGLIFAHRDFGQIIQAVEQKKPFAMMT
ncbi:tryptophan--tRNA ligase, partial [Candidatus Woesearchaeota archaeon]|nr:tryptophan--tRNA ligase [Candidatus Woesearchaeota archaeon]